ncbi:MAG: Lrp/AsnC family transcriptional regulator [Firmicutes bacterium]|nr:Lrp/AsnC family transcriptional regulator [Bacillota bacterium]
MNKHHIDSIDCKIINQLQKNSRISISRLSKEVNLSSPAVKRRISLLEESGIISGYHASIDTSKLGFGVKGYIIISIQKMDIQQFIQHIENLEEIIKCETIIAGGKELILQFVCKDNKHLMELYDKLPYSFIDEMTAYITLDSPDYEGIINV